MYTYTLYSFTGSRVVNFPEIFYGAVENLNSRKLDEFPWVSQLWGYRFQENYRRPCTELGTGISANILWLLGDE